MLYFCLACIIAGEAGICDLQAQIAVAHVWHNRQEIGVRGGWYGWAEPHAEQIYIAENYLRFSDPTNGAVMLVNDADLPRVAQFTASMRLTFTSTSCLNGQRLYAYAFARKLRPRKLNYDIDHK